jgi:hypothetical protein
MILSAKENLLAAIKPELLGLVEVNMIYYIISHLNLMIMH